MTGDIDSTIPSGLSHLIERSSSIIHQHGGVATEIAFDSLEEMSIADFIKRVVPTLNKQKDRLIIIKDSTSEQLIRILNDNVAVYHITGLQDVFYDVMLDRLMADQQVTIMPNMQYPLILWRVEQNGEKVICVEIPENQFAMHHEVFHGGPHVIWHPRFWLKMRLSVQNVPFAWRLRAVESHPQNLDEDHVCYMPFPNIFDSGDICWGNTNYNRLSDRALTENEAVLLTLDRFFNSTFNLDLIDNRDMLHMQNLYEQMPPDPEVEEYLKGLDNKTSKRAYMARMFHVFKTQEGLSRFKLRSAETAREFLEANLER